MQTYVNLDGNLCGNLCKSVRIMTCKGVTQRCANVCKTCHETCKTCTNLCKLNTYRTRGFWVQRNVELGLAWNVLENHVCTVCATIMFTCLRTFVQTCPNKPNPVPKLHMKCARICLNPELMHALCNVVYDSMNENHVCTVKTWNKCAHLCAHLYNNNAFCTTISWCYIYFWYTLCTTEWTKIHVLAQNTHKMCSKIMYA